MKPTTPGSLLYYICLHDLFLFLLLFLDLLIQKTKNTLLQFIITSKKARALQREKNPLISIAGLVEQTMHGRLAGYEIEPSHRYFFSGPEPQCVAR